MTYTVRFVNPERQYQQHREEYLATIGDVLSRVDLIDRKDLKEFEERLAQYVGVEFAVGVNSGTNALSCAFEALGLAPGDEVITVAHTYMSSISSIAHCGAIPVLIDVGKDFNMDPAAIEAAITPRTKAIEVVHLNGRLADMERIMTIARSRDLFVVEDACQALGATLTLSDGSKKMAGSFGSIGCFSFYPFKSLGCFGDGGAAVMNDPAIERRIRLLRYNGQDRRARTFYYHGYTCLLDNLQAALLTVKFKYLPQWVERRREIAEMYRAGLRDVPSIRLPHYDDPRFFDTYQNYVIRAASRDELQTYLEDSQKVETMIFWPRPNYQQPVLQPNRTFLPETERICREVLSLPMYPELTNEEVSSVIDQVKGFYGSMV